MSKSDQGFLRQFSLLIAGLAVLTVVLITAAYAIYSREPKEVDASAAPQLDAGDTTKVSGLIDLSRKLAASPKANLCFAKQVFRDAFGRVETPADNCLMASLYQAVRGQGAAGSLRGLLKTLVMAPQFKLKMPAQ